MTLPDLIKKLLPACLTVIWFVLTSCQTVVDTAKTGSGPSWHTVFQDDFNRPDGLLTSSNWSIYDFSNPSHTNTMVFTHNNQMLAIIGPLHDCQIVYVNSISYGNIRMKFKLMFLTNTNNHEFGVELKNNRSVIAGASDQSYLMYLAEGDYLILSTNGNMDGFALTNITYTTNVYYNIEYAVNGHQMSCKMMDSNLNELMSITGIDSNNLFDSGKAGFNLLHGYYYVDDLLIEAYY